MSFDVIVMNPPFTRSTGHEGKKINVPRPMFAAFGSSNEEQKLMAKATRRLTVGTSVHGNAGEASIFLVLADRKIKPGGVLAFVMPLSLISGEAWENSRRMLANHYGELVVLTIAGFEDDDMSFSADTGMGECLIIGRKATTSSSRAVLVVLKERPAYPLLGATVALELRRLIHASGIRRLEDGPVGGIPSSLEMTSLVTRLTRLYRTRDPGIRPASLICRWHRAHISWQMRGDFGFRGWMS